jgi:DNA topoisomerase-1
MAKKPMTTEEKTRRQKKCKSVRHLAENIHSLRSKVSRDLKSDDEKTRLTALAISLMDKTASRVGNSGSAKDGHYGVTGWQNKHVTISGKTVTIKYVGKSGVDQEKTVTDATIAKMLKKCKGDCKGNTPLLTTSDGISIKSAQVNKYLKEFGITAKDIRGYGANTLLVNALKSATKSSDEKERQKKFREVMKAVAEKVGHQQATLKQHYLLPGIEEAYVKNSRIKEVKNASMSLDIATDMGRELIASRVARWAAESLVEFDGPTTELEHDVRKALAHYNVQHQYQAGDWGGLEKFHLKLAQVVESVVIEMPVGSAFYDYPSTYGDNGQVGQDWRYTVVDPTDSMPTIINAHSMVHDNSWTLSTTIYSSNQTQTTNPPITHFDPWVRSMLWTIEVLTFLQVDESVIDDIKMRMAMGQRSWKRIKEIKPKIELAVEKLFGREADFADYTLVVVADWDLPEGKAASYNYDDKEPWGTMAISPKVFEKGIFDIAITHELCHAALGPSSSDHGEEFQRLAAFMGIPKDWRD